MLKHIKYSIKFINDIYDETIENLNFHYKLIEIDTKKSTATMRISRSCRLVKFSFSEILNDVDLIQKLTSTDACLIGICYGKMLRQLQSQKNHYKENFNQYSIALNQDSSVCFIIGVKRNGKIAYMQKGNLKIFTSRPIHLARSEKTICLFNPHQACHIGLLAGLEIGKRYLRNHNNHRLNEVNQLRIIK